MAAVVLGAGLALVMPSTAQADVDPGDPTASYVSVDADGTLSIGASWLDNRITISPTSYGRVKIIDEAAPIHEWAPDCMKWTDYEYDCGLSGPITGLFVNGGSGNDVIVNLYPVSNPNRAKIYGGFGADTIYGGPGSQQVFGGLEPEDLRWNGGVDETSNDQLFGGCSATCSDGGDVIRGGPGIDTYVGGSGAHDAVSYSNYYTNVNASLNGIADDGPSGELELVPNDVEDLVGGQGYDILIGDNGSNGLYGQDNGDQMYGLAGNDHLSGGAGRDRIYGGCAEYCVLDGDDRMYGGTGDDDLMGGGDYNHAVEYANEGNDVCQAQVVEGCERIVTS